MDAKNNYHPVFSMPTFYYQFIHLRPFLNGPPSPIDDLFSLASIHHLLTAQVFLDFTPIHSAPTPTHIHTRARARVHTHTHTHTHTPLAGTRTACGRAISHFDPFTSRNVGRYITVFRDTSPALHPSAHPGSPWFISRVHSSSRRHAF